MGSSRISPIFINNLLKGYSLPGLSGKAIHLNKSVSICAFQDVLFPCSVPAFPPCMMSSRVIALTSSACS